MMKKMQFNRFFIAVLFCTICFLLPHAVSAKSKLVPVKGAVFNLQASLKDNLKRFVGKKVYIHLDSGQTLSGSLKGVGGHLIHLEKLDRKDFFDALIKIENIIAFDTRFRKYE